MPNHVTIPVVEVKLPEPLATKVYELRTLDGSPLQNINVPVRDERDDGHVVTFAAFRGVPMSDAEGRWIGRPPDRGARNSLTDKMLDELKTWVANHVVIRSEPMRGVYALDHKVVKQRADAEPLARYVAIIEITAEDAAAEAASAVVENALGETVG